MIWIIVIGIVGIIGFILIKYFSDLNKDKYELQGQSLNEKFAVIVTAINSIAFNGNGKVTLIDKRSFNLYEHGQNQIIFFHYSTGHLTIIWKYKYFQKEIVHEKQFNNVRSLSIFEQQKIADTMIREMEQVVENHKKSVSKKALGEETINEIKRQTSQTVDESIELKGIDGLAGMLQQLYNAMGHKRLVSSNGIDELIYNDIDPDFVNSFFQIKEIINNPLDYSLLEVQQVKFIYDNMINQEIEEMRNQGTDDRKAFVQAGVKKITHLFDGEYGYSIDYEY